MTSFFGMVENGKLSMPDSERRNMRVFLLTLTGRVRIEIKKYREKRTDPQNRYYWGVVVEMISKHTGYDKDEVHSILGQKFLLIVDDAGNQFVRSTTKLNTKEMCEYVDDCRRFAASELQMYIPDPDGSY